MTQSVISAYESGRRQPSLPALSGLVNAAGYELVIELAETPHRIQRLDGPVGRRVRLHREAMKSAAGEVGVTNLRVFGSVARGDDHRDSDVDLLVDLPDDMGLPGLIRLGDRLEAIVGAHVDLVPAEGLKAHVRKQIESELVPL